MKVNAHVYVMRNGAAVLLRPGDEVPEGVRVTNPDVVDSPVEPVKADEPADEAPAAPEAPEAHEDAPEAPEAPKRRPAAKKATAASE